MKKLLKEPAFSFNLHAKTKKIANFSISMQMSTCSRTISKKPAFFMKKSESFSIFCAEFRKFQYFFMKKSGNFSIFHAKFKKNSGNFRKFQYFLGKLQKKKHFLCIFHAIEIKICIFLPFFYSSWSVIANPNYFKKWTSQINVF